MMRLLIALVFSAASLAAAEPLTLEQIFSEPGIGGYAPTQVRWRPDGGAVSYILRSGEEDKRDLWIADAKTGEKEILVPYEKLTSLAPTTNHATDDERERERRQRYSVAAYLWAPDSQSILFTSAGQLFLYDVVAREHVGLAPEHEDVRDPKFAPDGNRVSFLSGHDLWIAPLDGKPAWALTRGATDTLFHGDLDWVYPEEFRLRKGYHWSPDGEHIAFLELDQSRVPTYPIPDLLGAKPSVDLQHYPRAGDANPAVRVGIVPVKKGRRGAKPVYFETDDEYIPRIQWIRAGVVAVQTLDRAQDHVTLWSVDAETGAGSVLTQQQDPYWINIGNDLNFLADGSFVWTTEESGFRHIAYYGADGKRTRMLTSGEWEVISISALDEKRESVYFVANRDNTIGADLYRVPLRGGEIKLLTTGKGTSRVEISPDSGAAVVTVSALMEPANMAIRQWAGDVSLPIHAPPSIDSLGLTPPEIKTIEGTDGATIRLQIHRPAGEAPEVGFPVLMYVYGGPHAPTIRDSWGGRGRTLFHHYLAQKGYVVVQVDDRASSIPGHKYEALLHRDYGPTALEDYETAARYLTEQDFVDEKRIAIWGWSGGGMSTVFALTHSKLFAAGIAVAPVTDWRLYDSIYTERYMGLPGENKEAYARTSCIEAAADLHGSLLLIHGTADDNVHIQNTMQMVDALIEAGKQHDVLVYPGKTHSIYGPVARKHLYAAIERHLEEHLR